MGARMGGDGIFAKFQPRYAEYGIPTFPVDGDKKPCTKGYLRTGLRGSKELALKFTHAKAFGMPLGRRSGITVLDIDTRDEAALEAAEKECGRSPLVVQSAGGHHAYYRHQGEGRHIRPWGLAVPRDLLGGGFVIAPPSQVVKGEYKIVRGTLDDLKDLPPLHVVLDGLRQGPIPQGVRNDTVFRRLLRESRHCDDFDSLLDVARSLNMECIPPLTDTSVLATAKKVWEYETNGNNWVGKKARASTDREEILAFKRDPYAAHLLNLLRVSHPTPDAVFAIDQVKTSQLLEWNRQTLGLRIRALMNAGHLKCTHVGKGKGDPHLYQLVRR